VAVGVFFFQRTGSALLVASMTMLRLLPMGLLGTFMGTWAERIERRWALAGTVLFLGIASATLALLAWTDRLEVWRLAVTCFLNGLGWTADNPVLRVMIGDAVGAHGMGAAMSLDVGASNASRMAGPAMAGFLLVYTGVEGVFAVSTGLYGIALVAALSTRYRNGARTATGSILAQIIDGLRLVRTSPRLIGALLVTVIVNIFAFPFSSMIPVVARDRLSLGPEGVGVLASMDGLGAFLGALLYVAMLTAFRLAPNAILAGATLLLTGMGKAGFATMQATLVYLASRRIDRDEKRSTFWTRIVGRRRGTRLRTMPIRWQVG
jgi:MFS family permease